MGNVGEENMEKCFEGTVWIMRKGVKRKREVNVGVVDIGKMILKK